MGELIGYAHNLVKGKFKHESGQARLIRIRGRRGKHVNVTHDDVTVNMMFITPLQISRPKRWHPWK